MRPRLQGSQKVLFRAGRENLRLGRQFKEELLEDFEIELGIDIVEEEERGLVKTAAEKRQLRELQKEHDHLLLAAGKHFCGRPAVDRKREQIALWSNQRHPRAQFVAADPWQVVDRVRLVVDRQISNVIAVLRHDFRERATQRLGI